MHTTQHTRSHGARRGFTLTEAAAVAAAVTVLAASTVPVFRRVGCSAMRQQSAAQLVTLAAAHAEYAADFNGRQFTACPDDLGAFGGSFAAYQSANGCIPPMTVGTSASGQTTVIGYGTGSCPGTADGGLFQIPLNLGVNPGAFLLCEFVAAYHAEECQSGHYLSLHLFRKLSQVPPRL